MPLFYPLPLLPPRHIYALATLLTLALLGASTARALGEHMRDRTFYQNFSSGCLSHHLTLTPDLCAGTHRNREITLRWYRAEGSLSRPAVHLSVRTRRPPVDVEFDNGRARPWSPSPTPGWPPPQALAAAQMLPALALFDGSRARSGPRWEGVARMSMPQNAPFDLLWRTLDRLIDFVEVVEK